MEVRPSALSLPPTRERKMENLELWEKVCKTDPQYTKHVAQRGGYTSISPQYQIKEATEHLGPYGQGWGFESCDLDFSQLEATSLVIVKAVFFYELNGRHTFPINNSWPVKVGSGDKARVDPDFAKKAETNTMSKALSKLGFGADVFLGEFDNPDYLEVVQKEYALEKAENKLEEKARQEQQYKEWFDASLATISRCGSMPELRGAYQSLVRKANLTKDETAIKAFTKAKDARKTELEGASNDETVSDNRTA